MIKGIGIDIIELKRIQKSIENEKFLHRILTEREIKAYKELKKPWRQVEFVAGRFAAKEACAKAVGTGIGKLSFQHIEIVSNHNGAPTIKVKGMEKEQFFVSITHSKEYAVAQVIIEL
ncbi:holo-ACP synthase [Oceanobacillus halophilus]|uniref:Holo-[acyl-carrier-protein] synthase n=1 Tax=Oceanobacillus halophilus TaxID=930130 RepID=A0A494ZWC3_9BACI|nr:holo-ACP synthase [Oceanobacillus halophilus]RKQ30925.1 holo-[acyl-carrier-protein] synthase [Oceanobacillus halophilus]